jgi:hypothetical protein
VLALRVVKLDNAFSTLCLLERGARNCQYVAVRVPLDALNEHACVHNAGVVIGWRFHQLNASALISDAQLSRTLLLIFVGEALSTLIIPLDCRQWHFLILDLLEAHDFDRVLEVANIVINVYGTFGSTEEDGAAVRRPLNDLELYFKLFTPKARSLDRADNNSAIFVDDADFFSVGCPTHICDDTLVTVVDHLFVPVLLVEHPHYDQTLLVRRGQLLMLVIPLDDHNVALMSLQVLVHGQVATTLALSRL